MSRTTITSRGPSNIIRNIDSNKIVAGKAIPQQISSTGTRKTVVANPLPNKLVNIDKTKIVTTQSTVPWLAPNTYVVNYSTYKLDSTGLSEGAVTGLTVGGLYGQWFAGDWRGTISTGNIGTLPLSAPTLYTSISYGSRGEYYGFIAIGYFMPPTTGTYTFYTSSDDGSGVWIGDIASATSGRTAANATVNNGLGGGQGDTKRSGTISLTAGTVYAIRIVHEEGVGGDNLTFSWAGPGISETTNLAQYFYYSGNGTNYAVTTGRVGLSEPGTVMTTYGLNNPVNKNIISERFSIKSYTSAYYGVDIDNRKTILSNSNSPNKKLTINEKGSPIISSPRQFYGAPIDNRKTIRSNSNIVPYNLNLIKKNDITISRSEVTTTRTIDSNVSIGGGETSSLDKQVWY